MSRLKIPALAIQAILPAFLAFSCSGVADNQDVGSPSPRMDAGISGTDAGMDAGPFDAAQDGSFDAGQDASTDASGDAGWDAGLDAGIDGGGSFDGAQDGSFDAAQDASSDGGFDAGTDAGFDAGTDSGFDSGPDAGFDAGFDGGGSFDGAQDGSLDGAQDGSFDGGFDAGADTGIDAGFDAGPGILPPLAVLATNFSGSGSFPVSQQLELVFSDRVDTGILTANPSALFLAKAASPAVPLPSALEFPDECAAELPCKVVLKPAAPLDYSTAYMAVVLGGYPGGVCVPERNSGNSGGCVAELPIPGVAQKGLHFDFTTATPPPFYVVSTSPADGAADVPASTWISVTFSNPVESSSLSEQSICLLDGKTTSVDCGAGNPARIALSDWTLSADLRTATAAPKASLTASHDYTVVVTKLPKDSHGQNPAAYFSANFTTVWSPLIRDIAAFNSDVVTPPDSVYVRVRFTEPMDPSTVNPSTAWIGYTDEFGNTVPVPSDVALTDAATAVTRPDLIALASCSGSSQIPYSTTYKLHLLPLMRNADGSKNVSPPAGRPDVEFQFTAGPRPAIASSTYENSVVAAANLGNAWDVPVNSRFTVTFNQPLDPSSVVPETFYMEDANGGGAAVSPPATLTVPSPSFDQLDKGRAILLSGSSLGNNGRYRITEVTGNTSVTVAPGFASAESGLGWGLLEDEGTPGVIEVSEDGKSIAFHAEKLPKGRLLRYSISHRIALAGSQAGVPGPYIKMQNGNPLRGVNYIKFRTSDAMWLFTQPAASMGLNELMSFVIMASRPLLPSSLNDSTFYAVQDSVGKLPAVISASTLFPTYAVLTPVPSFRPGVGAEIHVTTGIQDNRGNPLPEIYANPFTVSSVGALPPGGPPRLEDPALTPSEGYVTPFQTFTITFPPIGVDFRNAVNPMSIGPASIELLEDPDGAGTPIPIIPGPVQGGTSISGSDKVTFRPEYQLKGGTKYCVTLRPGNMSNLYGLGSATASLGPYCFTGDPTPPKLGPGGVTPSGPGQSPSVQVIAWFDRWMSMAHIGGTSFLVVPTGTVDPLAGSYRDEFDQPTGQWKVIFTPYSPFRNAQPGVPSSFDVILTNEIRDMAMNRFEGAYFSSRFSITTDGPKLTGRTPASGAEGVAASSGTEWIFSAPLDPSTVRGGTLSGPSTFNLGFTDICGAPRKVTGCIKISGGGSKVVFQPAWPFHMPSSQVMTADFDAESVTDLAGNKADRNSAAPWSFTVGESAPAVLCHVVDAAAGTVAVRFTDAIQEATVTPDTFAVYEVQGGLPLAGTTTVTGSEILLSTGSAIPPGTYGILATAAINSTAGKGLIRDYNAVFEVK
jgi:hypothetical protein